MRKNNVNENNAMERLKMKQNEEAKKMQKRRKSKKAFKTIIFHKKFLYL